MWHIKIDYFNCENGILVLRSVKGADYDFNNLEESIRIKKNYEEMDDGLIPNLVDSSRITFFIETDFKGEDHVYISEICEKGKALVKQALSMPIFTVGSSSSLDDKQRGKFAYICMRAMEQVISYDPEHAFNLLENYVTSFKTVSQEFHDYLVEVWNGSRDLKRSGFENKNYIIKRHADESEIAYMNYVVNKYPDEKENIFGRQKVI